MDLTRVYVEQELRRVVREHPPRRVLLPNDLIGPHAERRITPRSILWWAGDRLVQAGELLRARGTPPRQRVPDA